MNHETAFECLQLVAATLKPRAKREVDKLVEKLSYVAPERLCHFLLKGVGTCDGLEHLSRAYGTETTTAAYAAALETMRQYKERAMRDCSQMQLNYWSSAPDNVKISLLDVLARGGVHPTEIPDIRR